MRLVLLAVALLAVSADDHAWQPGIWRDVQTVERHKGSTTVPMPAPPGTVPLMLTFSNDEKIELATIDGPDRLRYIARWKGHFRGVIINDPLEFAVDGDTLYVKGDNGKSHKLKIVSMIRLPEP